MLDLWLRHAACACLTSSCLGMQLRTELDEAGLCPERVELLWELYKKASTAYHA